MPAKSPQQPESVARHARQTRWQIVLPMLAAVALIAVLVGLVLWLPQRLQVGIVSDFLLTLFMLCPLALCMLPLTILIVVGALGAGRLHHRAVPPLRSVQERSDAIARRAASAADSVNRHVVNYGGRLGAVLRVFDLFEYPHPAEVDRNAANERDKQTDHNQRAE